MARMTAAQAAICVLEKEGISQAFGVPGAAINPFYAAMRQRGSISATSWRGMWKPLRTWPRATPAPSAGNIGLCIGTSGPAGTDMITGLYSAQADSIPILCVTGQAPRARLYKEDFQAVDIESIAKPVTKWAVTVREPALAPRVFQQAFHLMRSGRPGPVLIDLPFDVQMAERSNSILDTYEPLPVYKPAASRKQIEKALTCWQRIQHKPLIVAGGGIINADAADLLVEFAELTGVPVIPTLMGHGAPSPTTTRSWPAWWACRPAPLWQRDDARQRLRARHRQPLGEPPHRLVSRPTPRAASSCTWTSSPRRSAACSSPIRHRLGRESRARTLRARWRSERKSRRPAGRATRQLGRPLRQERKRLMLRQTHFEQTFR